MPRRSRHNDLHAPAAAIARHEGFAHVFHDLVPGRRGERCDTLAIAPRYIADTGWPSGDQGDKDEYINFGDSLVLEEKWTRSDFLRDNGKPWRDEDPLYGRFFAYVACTGVIRSADELRPWQGWYEVDPQTGLWKRRKPPLRRHRLIWGHELVLLAKHASRQQLQLMGTASAPPTKPAAQGVCKPRPQPRKGDRDLNAADRVLSVTPWLKAATVISLAEREHGHVINDSPTRFAGRMKRAGFAMKLDAGVQLFGPRDAAESETKR